MKKLLTLSLVLFLSSCLKEGKETVAVNNPNFNVTLLFEADGCKVYRFKDGGSFKYFTNCKGNVSWSKSEGKNHILEQIDTSVDK